jgi:aminoglycoside/choline kinase family phosphotransferase
MRILKHPLALVRQILNQESTVSSRPIPAELLPWALSSLGLASDGHTPVLTVVAGDASNRRYFRSRLAGQSYVLAQAPPATEKNEAFGAVREVLARAGVKVPALYAADMDRGYLLLEDLGDRLLLPELDAGSADHHYRSAFGVLRQIAALDADRLDIPAYDQALLGEELSRFPTWFVEALLGYSPNDEERDLLQRFFARLIDSALEQPRVLVHRDFHSRNLMPQEDGQLAVIDFQDAVVGPVTYDLVSLLRDCYIQWPPGQVCDWALQQRDALHTQGLLPLVDDACFLRWFDWMGLQRHIKVLGTFARLYLRDGKSAYLDDLPLVIHYVLEILGKYAGEEAVFAEVNVWFSSQLSPLIARQDWSKKV